MDREAVIEQLKHLRNHCQRMIDDDDPESIWRYDTEALTEAIKVLSRERNLPMKNYDPNIRWGRHIIQVTLQQWEYIGHLTFEVGGNCTGRDVLDFDFNCCVEETESDCKFQYHEDDDYLSAILKDENGNTLEVEGDADEFNQMIVKIEITDYAAEKQD